MREMGFKMNPSAVGSGVRFDPSNPKDRSITFQKRKLGYFLIIVGHLTHALYL